MPGYDEWLALIESLPGAAKAVAELVGEVGHLGKSIVHIGTAKANQISGRLDANSAAEQKIIAAQSKSDIAAIDEGTKSLVARAKQRRLTIEARQQANREAVTRIALESLIADPPPAAPRDEPSDDWLNIFGAYAEKASSETMREHWARILEGEIRNATSFSFSSLFLASLLDQHLANCISRIAPFILERRCIPRVSELSSQPLFQDVLDMSSIGFLDLTEGFAQIVLDEEKSNVVPIGPFFFRNR